MLARIYSCAVVGLEGVIVEVEVDTTQGFPDIDFVRIQTWRWKNQRTTSR
ncbi:MAG: hypothetical protein HY867_21005 [Chloroflexi bacterium]|nr:hypothetical protein [Chloroflexota bacterium]